MIREKVCVCGECGLCGLCEGVRRVKEFRQEVAD